MKKQKVEKLVLSTLLSAIAQIFSMLINTYIWVLVIAVLISWVRPDPNNPIVQILYRVSAPYFELVRRVLPAKICYIAGLDLSPLFGIVFLEFVNLFFVQVLANFARML